MLRHKTRRDDDRLRIAPPSGTLGRGGHRSLQSASIGAQAVGAQAIGALAIGALAIGALAIGALAIGRLAIGRSRIRRLEIDDLVVRRLRIIEDVQVAGKNELEK